MILYRPVGLQELALIYESGMKAPGLPAGTRPDVQRFEALAWIKHYPHGAGQRQLLLTISAAFSPIIIVGAFVLPDVIDGITEASATRSP